MSFKKSDYCTLVQQASEVVPGFRQAYNKFVEHATIHQKSESLRTVSPRQGGAQKTMALDGPEFLRRFCLHILPPGFRKVRHYGILSSRAKPKLKMQQMKMGVSIVPKVKMDWKQVARETMGFDADACPCCLTGRMHTIYCFGPNAPPHAGNISIPHQQVA